MKNIFCIFAFILTTSVASAADRVRPTQPPAPPNHADWVELVFTSAPLAYGFATSVDTRAVITTIEPIPHYVVFFQFAYSTISWNAVPDYRAPRDSQPIAFTTFTDRGAALALYDAKPIANKGLMSVGAEWLVWWAAEPTA